MANKLRGETEISLGGESYTLRPTFNALTAIEEKADLGLQGIAMKIIEAGLDMKTIAAIIYGGLIGGGYKLDFEDVGQMVVAEGMNKCVVYAMSFMTVAMSGTGAGDDAEKKSQIKKKTP